MVNLNDALWQKYENHMLNEGLSKNRMDKLKMTYRLIRRGINDQPFEKLKRTNIETFIFALNRNEFKKEDGGDYSGNTKADIKKFLKQFYKWLKGNGEHYPPEVSWIKARISKDEQREPETILSYDDVVKLSKGMSMIQYKTFVLMMFDSGFRISEMLSVNKRDITFEEYDGAKKCFWIKCNKSKTFVRKIPVPLFTEDIQSFINSVNYRALKDNEPLFTMSKAAISHYLKENGEKIIKRGDLHPHLFRHSSATYWAKELDGNTVALAQRFGWTLSADELKTYVRMSGAFERASAKKVYDNESVKLRNELNLMKEQSEKDRDLIRKMAIIMVDSYKQKKDMRLVNDDQRRTLLAGLKVLQA